MARGRGRRVQNCESFKVFQKNLGRAEAFVRIFTGDGRDRGQPTADEKELLRGAVVFSIAALDAFLHDLVLEILPKFAPKSDDLSAALKAIGKEDPALALRVALAPTRDAARAEFREALGDWISAKSFQGPEAVVRALSYLDLSQAGKDLDALSGLSDTASTLTKFTKMRHEIVHRAANPQVKLDGANECIVLVNALAKGINDHVVPKFLH